MIRRLVGILVMAMCSVMMVAEPKDSVSQKQDTLPAVDARIVIAERDTRSWISSFGHVGLHLICKEANLDYAFSFETDYDVPMWDMLRGEPAVSLMPIGWNEYKDKYLQMGREVREYGLNLTPGEKRKLWKLVDGYVKQGNYLSVDLIEHGCSEEIVSFINASIDGTVEYDKAFLPENDTPYTIGEAYCPAHSFMRLGLSMVLNAHSIGDPLPEERRLMLPYQLYKMLSHATIIPSDGGAKRPYLIADVKEKYVPATPLTEPNLFRVDYLLYVLLALTIVIGALEFVLRDNKIMKASSVCLDTVLIFIYSVITLMHLILLLFCKLPSATGWDWDIVAYNIIPLLVYLFSKYRPFTSKNWSITYSVYTLVLVLFLVYMIIKREHFVYEQMLLVLLFAIRCSEKMMKFRLNKQNK